MLDSSHTSANMPTIGDAAKILPVLGDTLDKIEFVLHLCCQ